MNHDKKNDMANDDTGKPDESADAASQPPVPRKGHIYPLESFATLESYVHLHLNRRLLVPQNVVDDELEADGFDPLQRRAMFKRSGEKKGVVEKQDAGETDGAAEEAGSAGAAGEEQGSNDSSGVLASGETQPETLSQQEGLPAGDGAGRRRQKRPRRGKESGTLAEILATYPQRERWRVIREDTIKALGDTESTVDADMRVRNKAYFKKLEPMGEYRRVARLPRPQMLEGLRQSHPHFAPVIDFIGDRLALAARSRQPVRIPPILLGGPPGIGKTHFCSALATVLGVPCRRHQMDQAETSSALLGSEKTWSNTRVGLVFEAVVLGEYANPIIILDELDKANRKHSHSGATAVLHTLLEPVTSGAVRDLSADIEFDASLITWVATCNYPWQIEPTLLSRMKCFWIDMPDASQALMMVKSVAEQAVKDAAMPGFEVPGREILVEIAHYSARQQYQIIGEAVARSVRDNRRKIFLSDIERWLVRETGGAAPNTVLH